MACLPPLSTAIGSEPGTGCLGGKKSEKVPFFSSRTAERQSAEGPKNTRQPLNRDGSLCPLLMEAAVPRASAAAQTWPPSGSYQSGHFPFEGPSSPGKARGLGAAACELAGDARGSHGLPERKWELLMLQDRDLNRKCGEDIRRPQKAKAREELGRRGGMQRASLAISLEAATEAEGRRAELQIVTPQTWNSLNSLPGGDSPSSSLYTARSASPSPPPPRSRHSSCSLES